MNQELFTLLHGFSFQYPLVDGLILFLAELFGVLLVLALIAYVFVCQRSWRSAAVHIAVFVGVALLARLIAEIPKLAVASPRPFVVFPDIATLLTHSEPLKSFPSGHVTFFAALATAVFFYRRNVSVWLFVGAFFIGIARVIAGIHWPLDIAVGWLLGIVVAALTVPFLRKVFCLNQEKKS